MQEQVQARRAAGPTSLGRRAAGPGPCKRGTMLHGQSTMSHAAGKPTNYGLNALLTSPIITPVAFKEDQRQSDPKYQLTYHTPPRKPSPSRRRRSGRMGKSAGPAEPVIEQLHELTHRPAPDDAPHSYHALMGSTVAAPLYRRAPTLNVHPMVSLDKLDDGNCSSSWPPWTRQELSDLYAVMSCRAAIAIGDLSSIDDTGRSAERGNKMPADGAIFQPCPIDMDISPAPRRTRHADVAILVCVPSFLKLLERVRGGRGGSLPLGGRATETCSSTTGAVPRGGATCVSPQ